MTDFGILPPEVNSARMYAGPGSGPLLAAGAAWFSVATATESLVSAYTSEISGVTAAWRGPSATAMAAAARRYMTWLTATASKAHQMAAQARAAVAAYEQAFAAVVPPPAIVANRSQWAYLVATNILGQNTAAIAAVELDYAAMWEQDAIAMYGYAQSAASAVSGLPLFNSAPDITNSNDTAAEYAPAGEGGQITSTMLQSLHNLSAPALSTQAASSPSSLSDTLLNVTIGSLSPMNIASIPGGGELGGLLMYSMAQTGVNFAKVSGTFAEFMEVSAASGAGTRELLVSYPAPAGVSAGLGRAALVSNLSVPPGWASAAPAMKPAAVVLPTSSPAATVAALEEAEAGNLFSDIALSGLAGRAIAGTGGQVGQLREGAGRPTKAADSATINIILITEDEPLSTAVDDEVSE